MDFTVRAISQFYDAVWIYEVYETRYKVLEVGRNCADGLWVQVYAASYTCDLGRPRRPSTYA